MQRIPHLFQQLLKLQLLVVTLMLEGLHFELTVLKEEVAQEKDIPLILVVTHSMTNILRPPDITRLVEIMERPHLPILRIHNVFFSVKFVAMHQGNSLFSVALQR